MGRLLAIDGLNIVRRVYEANAEPDSAAKAEAALHNALLSFRRLLHTHTPTHVLPAFDAGGANWRHVLHPQYRAGRSPMPPELRERMPDLYRELVAMGLHVVVVDGVEAGDVIATGVLRWLAEGRGEAVVASTDRRLLPLLEQGALIWDHFRSAYRDRDWVREKHGVPPEMLTDLFALVGDADDGIPGVPKVGKKTAAGLLNTYGTLAGIMRGAGILLDPLGQKLRAGHEAALLSRQLVQLKTDVHVGVTWKTLRYEG